MTKGYYPKKLLVEGAEDQRVLPELLELNGISWGRKKENVPVFIQDCEGYENINADLISTELQAGGLTNLGVMIDADDSPSERWQSIRNSCLKSIPDMPKELPDTGLIHTTDGMSWAIASSTALERNRCYCPFRRLFRASSWSDWNPGSVARFV